MQSDCSQRKKSAERQVALLQLTTNGSLHYLYLAVDPIESPLRIGRNETIVLLLAVRQDDALPREIALRFIGHCEMYYLRTHLFYLIRTYAEVDESFVI